MKPSNVNDLDIDEMLTRSEITAGILRVVYALQEVDDYTKEEAAQALINFLGDMGYLEEINKGEGK